MIECLFIGSAWRSVAPICANRYRALLAIDAEGPTPRSILQRADCTSPIGLLPKRQFY